VPAGAQRAETSDIARRPAGRADVHDRLLDMTARAVPTGARRTEATDSWTG